MNEEYVEAILLWGERGPSEAVSAWFRERSFDVRPMRAGLLLAGSHEVFEKTFHLPLAEAVPPIGHEGNPRPLCIARRGSIFTLRLS